MAVVVVGARAYAGLAVGLVGGCIVATFLLYVAQGDGPVFLPTISNTWEDAPATYVSRFCVSNGCFMLAVLQLFLYYGSSVKRRALLWMGLAATFCLSWVGAICDVYDEPSCRGNHALHTVLATTFFVLYDLKMLLTAALAGDGPSAARRRRSSFALPVASTALTAARLALAATTTSQWLQACFEYANVTCIMAWTYREVARTCERLHLQFGGAPHDKATRVLWSMPTARATRRTLQLLVGTLLLTTVIALALGQVPTTQRLWYASDVWRVIPGNWISRWAVPLGAHFGWLTLGGLSAADDTPRRRLFLVAGVGLLGLSIAGCCNASENAGLHAAAALLFFACMDVYVLGTRRSRTTAAVFSLFLLLGSVFVIVVQHHPTFILRRRRRGLLSSSSSVLALLEWANAIAIPAFVLVDVVQDNKTPSSAEIRCLGIAERRPRTASAFLSLEEDDDDLSSTLETALLSRETEDCSF